MSYDVMVISAHPDDAEVQMGGTIALLTAQGKRVLLVEAYAEAFKSQSPLLVHSPTVFLPALHG